MRECKMGYHVYSFNCDVLLNLIFRGAVIIFLCVMAAKYLGPLFFLMKK